MRNITIVVEEEVAEWARVHAAKEGTSVSKIVGEMLRDYMEREQGYEAAMLEFMSRMPTRLKEEDASYPSRDELHER